MNEQSLLGRVRCPGPCSRAAPAAALGLPAPAVPIALAKPQAAGRVREAGQRTGVPGRSATLFEVRSS